MPRATWLKGWLVVRARGNSPRQANSASTGTTAKKERKNTISPAGTWPASLIDVDMPTKMATEATLSAMPVRVLPRRSLFGGAGLTSLTSCRPYASSAQRTIRKSNPIYASGS